jgi:hypothetical protein
MPKLEWRKSLLVVINVVLGMITCLVWLEARFLLAFLPLTAILVTQAILMIPTGTGDEDLPHWYNRFLRVFPWRIFACIILISLSFLPLGKLPVQFEDQAVEYQLAANWLKDHKSPGESIFAAKPHIAYFSDTLYDYFRDYDLEDMELADLPALLAQIRPTYMIFDQRYAAWQFPRFEALIDPGRNPYPELLVPAFTIDQPYKLIIYEVHLPITE